MKSMIELDRIYNEDCLIGMQRIPDGSVDCIICDLPYGVLNRNNKDAKWDNVIPLEPLWEQYLRVAKQNAAIVLFCQGMFTAQLMMSQPKLWRYNLVWDKINRITGFLNANRCPLRIHEDIAVFYRKQPTYNPQFTKGFPCHNRGGAGNGLKRKNRQEPNKADAMGESSRPTSTKTQVPWGGRQRRISLTTLLRTGVTEVSI